MGVIVIRSTGVPLIVCCRQPQPLAEQNDWINRRLTIPGQSKCGQEMWQMWVKEEKVYVFACAYSIDLMNSNKNRRITNSGNTGSAFPGQPTLRYLDSQSGILATQTSLL